MGKYLEKIGTSIKKYAHYIKAIGIKRKIMEDKKEPKNENFLDEHAVNPNVISIVLEDRKVIEKLKEDNKILYYISILNEEKQLEILNKNKELFAGEDKKLICEMALKNISIDKLLKTEFGTEILEEFPRECYKEISKITEDRQEEIENYSDGKITLLEIARDIFEKEDVDDRQNKKIEFLNEEIDIQDKIAILKEKTSFLSAIDILDSKISEEDKIKLIKNFKVNISISDFSYGGDEVKKVLLSQLSEQEYKNMLKRIFPLEANDFNANTVNQIIENVSNLGKENVIQYLSEEQKQNYNLAEELSINFEKEEIETIFKKFKSDSLEMNFLEKNPEIKEMNFSYNTLKEILEKDDGLFCLKKYNDFRKENNNLGFSESLFQSLNEYSKYGELYKEIIGNFNKLNDDEKISFRSKWNQLISLENKFEIKDIEDFKNMDKIEKEYYTNILENETSKEEIKKSIFEILVRNGNCDKITKLGNGTDYSMENKSLEDVIDMLSTVNEIKDINDLKGILSDCIDMIGTKELNDIREIGENIEEKITLEYREGYTKGFTNYDELSDEELKKMEGIDVKRINGFRVIELKGADFAFLSHSGGINGNSSRCCCTEITDENFSTFENGLNNFTYIYSKFNSDRIKFMNAGDAGLSDFEDTYISSKDIASSTQQYNEVTLSTGKENGEEKLSPNAIMTNRKVGSQEFENLIRGLSNDENTPKTVYVLSEEIYNEKNKQDILKNEEVLKKYLTNLDSKLLNKLLLETGGEKDKMNVMMGKVKENIKEHMNNDVKKEYLRKNITRYWQLSRTKEKQKTNLSYEIMLDLQEQLEKLDNELLIGKNIKEKVTEISKKEDEYGER